MALVLVLLALPSLQWGGLLGCFEFARLKRLLAVRGGLERLSAARGGSRVQQVVSRVHKVGSSNGGSRVQQVISRVHEVGSSGCHVGSEVGSRGGFRYASRGCLLQCRYRLESEVRGKLEMVFVATQR